MSDELLHERLRGLERALAAERGHRQEAEAMVAGLRSVATAEDLEATDLALSTALRPLLHYQHAAVLRGEGDPPAVLTAKAAGHAGLAQLRWVAGPLRSRVLAGQNVAIYDVQKVPELSTQLDSPDLRSLLCVGLSIAGRPAVLIGAHATPAYFGNHHVALARSLADTVRRMLESLDLRDQARQRALADERARGLARVNEALRDQLETIQSQRREIRRLRAPVLLVAERTLVVPLIGELDRESLAEVTESLLDAIMAQRARTIILDLTGFEVSDEAAVARLESLARSAAMLGARCELSGVRTATALAMSDLNVELRAHASLAAALAAHARDGS